MNKAELLVLSYYFYIKHISSDFPSSCGFSTAFICGVLKMHLFLIILLLLLIFFVVNV